MDLKIYNISAIFNVFGRLIIFYQNNPEAVLEKIFVSKNLEVFEDNNDQLPAKP